MKKLGRFVNKLKYWLLALSSLPFLCPWFIYADDLMYQVMQPAFYEGTNIDLWKSVNRVWRNVFKGKSEFSVDKWGIWLKQGPSIIVKVTRVLLSLVVALSITMILYHWMMYIIQTWQWKEWKNLIKNVVYIVIWIVISLFSVTIITLLQSVSKTFEEETQIDWSRDNDGKIIYNDNRYWIRFPDLYWKFLNHDD